VTVAQEELLRSRSGGLPGRPTDSTNLADILERVLDKGIVIAGDIQINLLDIELLTVKLRLLIASVDRAREMGINWWESDPTLQSPGDRDALESGGDAEQLQLENRELRERIERLEQRLGAGTAEEGSSER
jgi:Gas vesicle protein